MEQNLVTTGLGRSDGGIYQTLVEAGQETSAIDSSEGRVSGYMSIATHVVMANAQGEMMLCSLGIRNFDRVVVTVGEDIQTSILVTLMAKEIGAPNVLAKAVDEYHTCVLDKIGVDMVVHPERDIGIRVTHKLVSRNILDYIELPSEFSLAEARVTNPKFYDGTLAELNFRQRFGLTVVAIRHPKTEITASPSASEVVREDDNLLVIDDTADVDLLDGKMNG